MRSLVLAAAIAAASAAPALASERELPTLETATHWLNSKPLTRADLRGKVVLIDVWTYSCINWLRSLPYVRAWAAKYKNQGLIVIGVHAPEFPFERDVDNVRRAAKEMDVGYPIAIDNDYAIWSALNNEYWPAIYIADAQGRIRYHQFGEGEYDQTERVIQELLAETGSGGADRGLVSVGGTGLEAPADWSNLHSNENYVGFARTQNFSSPGGAALNTSEVYTAPERLSLNHWALVGGWTVGKQAIVADRPNARIRYRFHARDLHLVIAPPPQGTVRFRVLIDGRPPGNDHGIDSGPDGYGVVREPRLYQLIRQNGTIVDRNFEITFFEPGVEAYSFTFG